MPRRPIPAWCAALVCLVATGASHATTIVVRYRAHASAVEAARAEEDVDWRDANMQDDTVCTQAFAALELQEHLREMTGRSEDFAIADDDAGITEGDLIIVGGPATNNVARQMLPTADDSLARLGPEGYIIRTLLLDGGAAVLIAGGGRVGTLYGVYDFLHRLGVRWYAPGDANREVPRRELRKLPELDVREFPAFSLRGFHAWENRGDPDFLLWMARNRLNYWCVQQEQHALMHKLGILLIGGGHRLTDWYLGPAKPYPFDHAAFAGDEGNPPDPYPPGTQSKGDTNGDGTLTYFETHPEWYALRGGKRSSRIRGGFGDNFCTSDPSAMAEWSRNAATDLAEGRNREADIMNAWMLDAGTWCECEPCKAQGSRTDRNLLVVHHYAQAIREARAAGRIHRPIRLLFLAYSDVIEPPTRPLPADFDYEVCIATYFPICRCYVHDLDDPTCSKNANYMKHLRGWATAPERHYRGQICIGEYYNVSGYKCLPICFMHTMAHDIPLYHSLGARYFHYMHCTTGNWGNKALTNWQMARQIWAPETDCQALWDDYFAGRYGTTAGPMRDFYMTLEKMLANVTELKYGLARRLERGSANLFPNRHLKYDATQHDKDDGPDLVEIVGFASECRTLIDRARSREGLPARVRQRLNEDEHLFTYGETTVRFYDALCRAYTLIREGNREAGQQALGEARELAAALEADTTSAILASTHANAPHALSASYASGALGRLTQILGPPEPESVKRFDPSGQPLVLEGREFHGGGAAKYSVGFHVYYPVRRPASKVGNFVYGRGTSPYDRMLGWFALDAVPPEGLYLLAAGAKCPQPIGGEISGRILVNDALVFDGRVPFSERELTSLEVRLPPRMLHAGANTIDVVNTEPGGRVGNRPWFGVDRVELRTQPATEDVAPRPFNVPADLTLTYRSDADGSEQPYRVYLPSAYDGRTPLPLFIALHGTGGDQNTYFGNTDYGDGTYKREAEKRGIIVVCPHGRGTTEYRGIGENDVLTVIGRVKRQFAVDEDRVVCSGQSMGGTGTTYLCCRYPHLFAAGVSLASSYGHTNLLRNLRHVPMFYVQGQKDWPVYAQEGPDRITERLGELGHTVEYWVVPDQPHNTMGVSTERVLDWALGQRRVTNPRRVTFATYLPIHGRAYWLEIQEVANIGYLAGVDATVDGDRNGFAVKVDNVGHLALRPGPELLDLTRPLHVDIDGERVFEGNCVAEQELSCTLADTTWRVSVAPRSERPSTAYRTHRIGVVGDSPTQEGKDETSMGNWMCDMMRHVAGADIAIYNRRHYRGIPLRKGQNLHLVDLLNWTRPFLRRLCTFECTGRDLLDIVEANIRDRPKELEYLVQVAGCRYSFDRARPKGSRVAETDIDAARKYTVACEAQVLTRETLFLAGRFRKLTYRELGPTVVSGAWRYVVDSGGTITAKREGRVRDVTAVAGPPQ